MNSLKLEESKMNLMKKSINKTVHMSGEEIQEIINERDEALKSASNIRYKLQQIIKEKMKNETESILKMKKIESDLLQNIKNLSTENSKLDKSVNDKINTIHNKDK